MEVEVLNNFGESIWNKIREVGRYAGVKKKKMGYAKVKSAIGKLNIPKQGNYYIKIYVKRLKGTLLKVKMKIFGRK